MAIQNHVNVDGEWKRTWNDLGAPRCLIINTEKGTKAKVRPGLLLGKNGLCLKATISRFGRLRLAVWHHNSELHGHPGIATECLRESLQEPLAGEWLRMNVAIFMTYEFYDRSSKSFWAWSQFRFWPPRPLSVHSLWAGDLDHKGTQAHANLKQHENLCKGWAKTAGGEVMWGFPPKSAQNVWNSPRPSHIFSWGQE